MTQPNPYLRGSYEHEYYNARVSEIESSQDRYDAAMLELPEQATMRKLMTERVVSEIEPDHGHIGIRAREDLRFREIRAAIAQENRGELREPPPEPEWMKVVAWHDSAGHLTLMTDGVGWFLRHRGLDYGLGSVWSGEIHSDHLTPRPEILEAAAQRALSDPWGPEAGPDTLVFVGGPDGEPIEMTLREMHERETAAAQPPPSTSWLSNLLSRKEN